MRWGENPALLLPPVAVLDSTIFNVRTLFSKVKEAET